MHADRGDLAWLVLAAWLERISKKYFLLLMFEGSVRDGFANSAGHCDHQKHGEEQQD